MDNEITSWPDFLQSNPAFVETFSTELANLSALLKTEPLESDVTGALLWRFIFASVLDCNDILTLVSSGGYWGALKLLRSLFERTVTAKYLLLNPSESETFYEFDAIDYKNAMDAIETEAGLKMQPQSRANLDEVAKKARSRFKLEPCISCGKGGRMSSWTPRSVKELSEKTELHYMYFTAWVLPTKLIHPTFYGLEQTIISKPPIYDTLCNVHSLLVELILIHQRHFMSKLHPTQLMLESVERFLSVWTISRTNFGLPLQRV